MGEGEAGVGGTATLSRQPPGGQEPSVLPRQSGSPSPRPLPQAPASPHTQPCQARGRIPIFQGRKPVQAVRGVTRGRSQGQEA